MIQRFSYLSTLVLLMVVFNSCQPHDPFCYQHIHGAKVRIDVDWSEFKEEQPDGMTMLLYPTEESNQQIQHTSHNITHATFDLMPDNYTVMVHNQSASEFGSVTFGDMEDHTTAWVRPERRTSGWYTPVDNEILVYNPEWLAFNRQEAVVTSDMMVGEIEYDDHSTRATDGDETLIATLIPQNVVYTLHVSVKIKGVNNFREARAAFSGLADGYFIGLEEYSSDKVTHMMEDWSLKEKTTNADGVQVGTLTTEITCFGLPMGHSGEPADNILRLSLLLVDNKTRINRMFNVGSRIYQRTTNGSPLHLYLDLEVSQQLPDVVPITGDNNESGFDVDVEDWGDEENTNVGM